MQISKEDYQQYKPLLFSLGYRMLGSVADAEDLVQETFLKAYQIRELIVDNKKAYLCKMMTNLCLDLLKSARYKREDYAGPWNPEPLLVDPSLELDDPLRTFLQKEGLSIAYLRMMEHLAPDERAVLLLRDCFEFSYGEIAAIIEKKEDNCRKIFSRAKHKISHVEGESLQYEDNKSMVNRFVQAFLMHNMGDLLELLSEHVTLYSDGGGKVKAAIRPIASLSNVLAFLNGLIQKITDDIQFEIQTVNLQPAIVFTRNDAVYIIISFFIHGDQIREIYMTINPDKLSVPLYQLA